MLITNYKRKGVLKASGLKLNIETTTK